MQLPSREVHRWLDWAARHGIDADWRRTLIEVSGGGVSQWRVTEKPIRPTRWREVIDRREGTVLLAARGLLRRPRVTRTDTRHPLQPHIQLDARLMQRAAADTRRRRIGDHLRGDDRAARAK